MREYQLNPGTDQLNNTTLCIGTAWRMGLLCNQVADVTFGGACRDSARLLLAASACLGQ